MCRHARMHTPTCDTRAYTAVTCCLEVESNNSDARRVLDKSSTLQLALASRRETSRASSRSSWSLRALRKPCNAAYEDNLIQGKYCTTKNTRLSCQVCKQTTLIWIQSAIFMHHTLRANLIVIIGGKPDNFISCITVTRRIFILKITVNISRRTNPQRMYTKHTSNVLRRSSTTSIFISFLDLLIAELGWWDIRLLVALALLLPLLLLLFSCLNFCGIRGRNVGLVLFKNPLTRVFNF